MKAMNGITNFLKKNQDCETLFTLYLYQMITIDNDLRKGVGRTFGFEESANRKERGPSHPGSPEQPSIFFLSKSTACKLQYDSNTVAYTVHCNILWKQKKKKK